MNTAFQLRYAMVSTALCAISTWASAQSEPDAGQSRSAWLPSAVGLHLASRHDDRGPAVAGSLGWNDRTAGAYALWPMHRPQLGPIQTTGSAALGYIHRNSLFQPSVYAAYHLRSQALQTPLGAFSLGGSAGVFFVGYDKAIAPGVAHTGPVPAGHSVKVRCTAAKGCINQLVKPTPAPLLSAGLFWQHKASSPFTVGLQRLPRSGTTGSAAWTLTADWSF